VHEDCLGDSGRFASHTEDLGGRSISTHLASCAVTTNIVISRLIRWSEQAFEIREEAGGAVMLDTCLDGSGNAHSLG
jgi:hypothetical protein